MHRDFDSTGCRKSRGYRSNEPFDQCNDSPIASKWMEALNHRIRTSRVILALKSQLSALDIAKNTFVEHPLPPGPVGVT